MFGLSKKKQKRHEIGAAEQPRPSGKSRTSGAPKKAIIKFAEIDGSDVQTQGKPHKPAADNKGSSSVAAAAKPKVVAKRDPVCEYCGKPVDDKASQTGNRHDICIKEYRFRDKNSLCVYCGERHSTNHTKCNKYENYGTVKLVLKNCEYCYKLVNPKLNKKREEHDECDAEYWRRYKNDLCRSCGEEILDPKAEGSDRHHKKCDLYEGYEARDQHINELKSIYKPSGSVEPPAVSAAKTTAPSGSSKARTTVASATPATPPINFNTITPVESSAGHVPKKVMPMGIKPVCYDNVGGLDKEIKKLREAVELPLLRPDLFRKAGITAPKGVLLYGPSGTGKTLLAKTMASQFGVDFTYVTAPSLQTRWVGDTEKRTRKIFGNAIENAPAIIFIDDIDSLGKDRTTAERSFHIDITEQFLSSMDALDNRQVFVIGATNRPEALDPAFRRPGRFDMEIEIGMPDENGRYDILKIHTASMPLGKVDLKKIARLAHGFTGADIMAVVKAAGMSMIRDIVSNGQGPAQKPKKRQVRVTGSDFEKAINDIKPSILRDTERDVPDVKWDDIGGLDSVRDTIMEDVEWPRKYQAEYALMGIRTSKGILLHGPPGNGKTMIAKAIASGIDSNFITIDCSEIVSKRPGDTEKNIKNLFIKARMAKPCVLFFDEIDALLSKRTRDIDNSRIVSQILVELDGAVKSDGVVLVGATNRLDLIDSAVLRPGRFDKIIMISPPNEEGRKRILEIHVGKKPHGEIDFKRLAFMTAGFTGADIAQAVNTASVMILRRHVKSNDSDIKNLTLTHKDMEESILTTRRKLNLPAPNYVLGP